LPLPGAVVEIAATLEAAGFETWCVGGAIRDALVGEPNDDVDLATQATPEQVQKLFRRTVPVGLRFGTVGVLDRSGQLHEVTTFRRDVTTDGRHAVVEYGVSLDDDLARRDFTINAVAYHPIRKVWRDPFEGVADLERGVIRAVGDPAARFREDYLRILRAVRFASRLGFSIDGATWTAARSAAAGLGRLSAERVREEWFRGLESALSVAGLVRLWREVGAAERWLPGLLEGYPFAEPAPTPRDPVLLTIGLVRDGASLLARLKASAAEIERAARVARAAPAPDSTEPSAVRRWLSQVGPAADDLMTLDRWGAGAAPPWEEVVTGIRARGEATDRGGLAVTGDDLVAAGIPAGPALGVVLARLLEEVLEDPARNSRGRLLARAQELR
jgi:tRNA nucleotidyltransferase (CCA-adding enzyme)